MIPKTVFVRNKSRFSIIFLRTMKILLGNLNAKVGETVSNIVPIYKKGDKTNCSYYRGISFCQTRTKSFIQHPAVKVKSVCRGNYWELSLWISTQHINY